MDLKLIISAMMIANYSAGLQHLRPAREQWLLHEQKNKNKHHVRIPKKQKQAGEWLRSP